MLKTGIKPPARVTGYIRLKTAHLLR